MAKLTMMKIKFNPLDDQKDLYRKLFIQEGQEHYASTYIMSFNRPELLLISQTLQIKKCHRMNTDALRNGILEKIFTESPNAPVKMLYDIKEAVSKRPNRASDLWQGIPLVNTGNTCYLNSTVNGILSIKSLRSKLEQLPQNIFIPGKKLCVL